MKGAMLLLLSTVLLSLLRSHNPERSWLVIPLLLVCSWIGWKVFAVAQTRLLGITTELKRDRAPATIQTPPQFDPDYGFVCKALFRGEVIEVVLDVCMAAFSSSPKLDQGLTPEMAIRMSPTSRVAANSEPDSLVVLYRDGVAIGCGARVKTPRGEDLLLTACHVWDLEPTHMAKRGNSIPLKRSRLVHSSRSELLDYAMVELPNSYWTSMGIKAAHVKRCGAKTAVRLFGGSSSQDLFSTGGSTEYGLTPLELCHSATTFPGWSGTPLYNKGNVVGLHIGSQAAQGRNRACNIAVLFEIMSREIRVESSEMGDDSAQRELEHAEWVERMEQGVPYERYEIDGEHYAVGLKDYHRLANFDEERRLVDPSYRSWADRADSDDESLGSVMETPIEVETRQEEDIFYDAMPPAKVARHDRQSQPRRPEVSRPEARVDVMVEEARMTLRTPVTKVTGKTKAPKKESSSSIQQETIQSLNCQRAGSSRGCPPLDNLLDSADTTGSRVAPSTTEECYSFPLADRVAGLEKLVERLSHQISKLQLPPSPSSRPLDGQTEARLPKGGLSSFKPGVSVPRKPHVASKKPATASQPDTPAQNPAPASEKSPGGTKTSETKSRKSRARKKSTGKPAPESPSQ